MKFKSGQLFWGFLFLTIGVLFLLDKNEYYLFIPNDIISYWPLLIILWGVAIIVKGTIFRPIISVASGIFVGLFLYGSIFGFNHINHDSDEMEREISTSKFYEDYRDSTEFATLSLRTGIGKIKIDGNTDKLVSGSSSGVYNAFNFKTRYRNNTARVVLRHSKDEIELFGDNNYRNLELSLNQNPIWNIDIKVGAAKVMMDLAEYKIEEFNLETGATTTDLKFGSKYKNIKVNVEMGAATLKIRIPRESGCQIKGNMVLVVKDLEGFNDIGKKRFQTSNYESAKNKININFDGGVSTLKIIRY
jgi:LiaI-LiaF-like transmembrane region